MHICCSLCRVLILFVGKFNLSFVIQKKEITGIESGMMVDFTTRIPKTLKLYKLCTVYAIISFLGSRSF